METEGEDSEIETSQIDYQEKKKKTNKKAIPEKEVDRYYMRFSDAVDSARVGLTSIDDLKDMEVLRTKKQGKKLKVVHTGQSAMHYYEFFTKTRLSRIEELNRIIETIEKLHEEIIQVKQDILILKNEYQKQLTRLKQAEKAKKMEISRLQKLQIEKSHDELKKEERSFFVTKKGFLKAVKKVDAPECEGESELIEEQKKPAVSYPTLSGKE